MYAAAQNGNKARAGNNRRALGDIGNLVGSLSTRCNVKDENPGNCLKPQQQQPSRPITRRFAQENNIHIGKPPLVVTRPAVKKEKAAAETRQFVKKETLTAQLTAWSEEACGGFDSEMTDVEEPLPNIDEGDVGNQLAVVDYVEDIYSFYRKAETQFLESPEYMSLQPDINEKMRAILVDWLIEVHCKFQLMPETLFLTIKLIDRYLSRQSLPRKSLQLLGMTAMLIASKYEEVWAPSVKDFEYISDHAYTKEQILNMEKKMLNTLNFNLTIPTPYVFIVRFLKAASTNRQLTKMSFFLVELCLTEYAMLKFPPSLLAAAAVYTAQCCLKKSPVWSTPLQRHSGYTETQLRECAALMVSFHRRSGEGELTVVHKKYLSSRNEAVAGVPPAKLPSCSP